MKHKQGMTYEEIAAEYDVSKGTISGAIWRHVHKTKYKAEKQKRTWERMARK